MLASLGDVSRAAGDVAAARGAYGEAVEHGEKALVADPTDVEAMIGLAMECTRLAGVTEGASRAALLARADGLLAPLEAAHRVSPEARADATKMR